MCQTLKKLHTWEENKAVAVKMANKMEPVVKRLTVTVAGDFQAQVRMLLPPGADVTGATKYPMVLYV